VKCVEYVENFQKAIVVNVIYIRGDSPMIMQLSVFYDGLIEFIMSAS
jgi:hypothetical protein